VCPRTQSYQHYFFLHHPGRESEVCVGGLHAIEPVRQQRNSSWQGVSAHWIIWISDVRIPRQIWNTGKTVIKKICCDRLRYVTCSITCVCYAEITVIGRQLTVASATHGSVEFLMGQRYRTKGQGQGNKPRGQRKCNYWAIFNAHHT
jgi:hypothetical protein